MKLELNDEEAAVLREMIEERISDLGPEIHHTKTAEYTAWLKESREALRGILARLTPVEVS